MENKLILNEKGKVIGRQVGDNILDEKGKMVSRYIKSSDITVDKDGKKAGTGDQRERLL